MPLIFARPTPKIPSDARTVPDPPCLPAPPYCMFYGWILEPTLFGEGTIILPFSDGSTATFKRLMTGLSCIKSPTAERPRIASFAEAAKDIGVRTYLGKNLIPSAAKFQQVRQILHLVKDADRIYTNRYSEPVRLYPVHPHRADSRFERMKSLIASSKHSSHPSVSTWIAGRFTPSRLGSRWTLYARRNSLVAFVFSIHRKVDH
ncbi:hypothetical protein MVEN_02626900 [Mycena venus]|uniref:Uncharacterized protein n=1 Tax=Mycena venus TaxID=2733690 RepID=A0A8H6WTP5_9AGAR|nr:hypothetical protein MVEN_02626900 [Mycena venus]